MRRTGFGNHLSFVIAGLAPAVPLSLAPPCHPKRDARVKRAHDGSEFVVTSALRCARRLALALFAVLAATTAAPAQLRGHGGPVRAIAVAPDGKTAISGSFDTSAIRWSLERNAAAEVLRFHDGAVNAVAYLRDGRVATSGEDGRIALWRPGEPQPATVLEGHAAPVVALALSGDGNTLASASWDHTAR